MQCCADMYIIFKSIIQWIQEVLEQVVWPQLSPHLSTEVRVVGSHRETKETEIKAVFKHYLQKMPRELRKFSFLIRSTQQEILHTRMFSLLEILMRRRSCLNKACRILTVNSLVRCHKVLTVSSLIRYLRAVMCLLCQVMLRNVKAVVYGWKWPKESSPRFIASKDYGTLHALPLNR